MENDIEIKFQLKPIEINYNGILPSKENKQFIKDYNLFLLVGFSENIKQDTLLKIPISLSEKFDSEKKYKVNGNVRNTNYKTIRPDTTLMFYLFNYQENDDQQPANQRLSQLKIQIGDINDKSKMKLSFKNKIDENVLNVALNVEEITLNKKIGEDDKPYDTKNNFKKMEKTILDYIEKSKENKNKLFTKYPGHSERIVFNRDFEFFSTNYCFGFLDVKIEDTNEEFWENIFYKCMFTYCIEIGMYEHFKEVNYDDEYIKEMDRIYKGFNLKQKLGILTYILVLISIRSTYLSDFVFDHYNEKQYVEDFSTICMGSGDCEDLGKYIKVCFEFFTSVNYKNEALEEIKKLCRYYIVFLWLASVYSASLGSYDENNTKLNAHLVCSLISKGWMFDGDDIENVSCGKILLNPLYKKENKIIYENLKKIKEYEEKNGWLTVSINNEKLSTNLMLEGTGLFSPFGDKNLLKKEYKITDNLLKNGKYKGFYISTSAKIYYTPNDEKSFYRNLHVGITDFFINHHKYPTNIPKVTLSYQSTLKNGFIYGASYKDITLGNEKIIFIADVPLLNFENDMFLSNSRSMNKLRTRDMYLIRHEKHHIMFKPVFREMNSEIKLIDSNPTLPNLPLKIILESEKQMIKVLYEKLGLKIDGMNQIDYSILKNMKKDIDYYMLSLIDVYKYFDQIISFFKDHNQLTLLTIVRFDVISNLSYYVIVIKTKK